MHEKASSNCSMYLPHYKIYLCHVGMPNWTGTLLAKDQSPDVIASNPWQIFGCKNGA